MSTAVPTGDYDEWGDPVWTPNIHGNTGSAGYVSNEGRQQSRVQALREVVAEVTNGRIPAPERRGPGFY
jgi:hypothetical protein